MLKKLFVKTQVKMMAFLRDSAGATGIEYGMILSGVGLAVTTGVFMFGEDVETMMNSFSGYLNAELAQHDLASGGGGSGGGGSGGGANAS